MIHGWIVYAVAAASLIVGFVFGRIYEAQIDRLLGREGER